MHIVHGDDLRYTHSEDLIPLREVLRSGISPANTHIFVSSCLPNLSPDLYGESNSFIHQAEFTPA